MRCALERLHRSECGQGLIEYSLIVGVVAVGAIASLTLLGDQINGLYVKASDGVAATAAGEGTFKPPTVAAGDTENTGLAPAPPTLSGGPADGSEGDGLDYTNPTFTIAGDGTAAEFQCSRDGAAFVPCAGEEPMGPGLGPGLHTFEVRAASIDGTSVPTVRTWTVSGSG